MLYKAGFDLFIYLYRMYLRIAIDVTTSHVKASTRRIEA